MIKTKIIETPKVTILVVGGLLKDAKIELPANVTFNDKQGSLIYKDKNGNMVFIPLPPGKWKSVGFLKDIKEDVAKELVDDKYRYFPTKHQIFRNYKKPLIEPKVWFSGEGWNQSWNDPFGTATESLYSLIAANCKLENSLADSILAPDIEEWKAEEKTVFHNPYLLKKLD